MNFSKILPTVKPAEKIPLINVMSVIVSYTVITFSSITNIFLLLNRLCKQRVSFPLKEGITAYRIGSATKIIISTMVRFVNVL